MAGSYILRDKLHNNGLMTDLGSSQNLGAHLLCREFILSI